MHKHNAFNVSSPLCFGAHIQTHLSVISAILLQSWSYRNNACYLGNVKPLYDDDDDDESRAWGLKYKQMV